MNIGITPYTPAQNNTQNFKGLWGKTSQSTDFDIVMNIPKTQITTYYYPFLDENEDNINAIIKKNESADVEDEFGYQRYMLKQCKRGYTCPFTRQDYIDYYRSKDLPSVLPPGKIRTIDYHASDKFRNNAYGKAQKPARNPELRERKQAVPSI